MNKMSEEIKHDEYCERINSSLIKNTICLCKSRAKAKAKTGEQSESKPTFEDSFPELKDKIESLDYPQSTLGGDFINIGEVQAHCLSK